MSNIVLKTFGIFVDTVADILLSNERNGTFRVPFYAGFYCRFLSLPSTLMDLNGCIFCFSKFVLFL